MGLAPRPLRKTAGIKKDGPAISGDEHLQRNAAMIGSSALLGQLHGAIQRQAKAWGISYEQAQTLLLDRRMPS